ncbi:MAG: hypothetical protein ACE15D_17010 [Candidatus Eisenbacteria bacterium]|nr:hypothetical protein [Candidatus Eisenbacteria bacterium]
MQSRIVSRFPLALALALAAAAAFFLVAPAAANVIPESALLVHVQPIHGSCDTDITSCEQVIRTTPASGPTEFLIFYYPVFVQEDHPRIHQLETVLAWPETWQLVDFDACAGFGFVDPSGPAHMLRIDWPDCPASGSLFLVARLVLVVEGPGTLGFAEPWEIPIGLDCYDDPFVSYAFGFSASAGSDCEYTNANCAGPEYCRADFEQPRLDLSVPFGGTTQGQVEFRAMDYQGWLCDLEVDTRADWAEAEIVPLGGLANANLVVTADATGLLPGVYETEVQLSTISIARCLLVSLTVEESASAPEEQVPAGRPASWGKVKGLFR